MLPSDPRPSEQLPRLAPLTSNLKQPTRPAPFWRLALPSRRTPRQPDPLSHLQKSASHFPVAVHFSFHPLATSLY
ncbi:hypothetical protein B0T21DRAFT_364112 [Apiosordaria backusii]|uniref:Uncharacterized protein n=1 Tax=Apiosordaria backusii TaxID=314023 RepID=A0AA40BMN8_9PEZI|nr:hypothetical protein B0T21DRAFT_364112 [Apiosordaria backusii]